MPLATFTATYRMTGTVACIGLLFGILQTGCTSVASNESRDPRYLSAEGVRSAGDSHPAADKDADHYREELPSSAVPSAVPSGVHLRGQNGPVQPRYDEAPSGPPRYDLPPSAGGAPYGDPIGPASEAWDSQPASYQNTLRSDGDVEYTASRPMDDRPIAAQLTPSRPGSVLPDYTNSAPPSRFTPAQDPAYQVATPQQVYGAGQPSNDVRPTAQSPPAPAEGGQNAVDSSKPSPDTPVDVVAIGDDTPLEADMAAVQSQIKELEAAQEEGAEEDRAPTIKTLKSALDRLAIAQKSEQHTQQLRQQTDVAPETLKQVTAELEKSAGELRPQYPEDSSLSRLEQFLAEAQQTSKRAQEELSELEEQLKQRADLQTQLPQLVDEAKTALAEAEKQLKNPAATDGSPAMAAARHLEIQTRVKATKTQLAMYEAESARHEAVAELLPLQRDLAKRRTTQQQKLTTAWQEVVADFRKAESERQAQAARDEVKNADPALRNVAEENAKLAEERTAKASEIDRLAKELESIKKQLETLEAKHKEITEKVEKVGLSTTVGMLLRQLGEELPNVGVHRARIRTIERELPVVQLRLMELDEQRSEMGDLDAVEQQIVSGLNGKLNDLEPEKVQQMVRQFLSNKREYVGKLYSDYETLQGQLGNLEVATSNLIAKSDELRGYVEEHVLWIRSAKLVGTTDLAKSAGAIQSMASWQQLQGLFASGSQRLRSRPVVVLPLAALFAIPLLLRRRIRTVLDQSHPSLHGSRSLRFRSTLEALGATGLLAAFWPGLMWCVGWWLGSQVNRATFAGAFGNALQVTALLGLAAELLRQMASKGGLAEAHFGWPTGCTAALRRILKVLILGGLPLVALYVFLGDFQNGTWADSLGRLIFIGGMFVLAIASHFAARGSSGVVKEISGRDPDSPLVRFRAAWHALLVSAPLTLAGLAAVGYYYSAQQLALRLQITLWLLLGMLILHSLVCRLLTIWEHAQADSDANAPPTDEQTEEAVEDEEELDSASIMMQVRRLLGGVSLAATVVGIWLIWSQVLPALQVFNRVEFWSTTVEVVEKIQTAGGPATFQSHMENRPVTLGHLLLAAAILSVTMVATRNLPGLLRMTILDRLPMQRGGRHAVAIICRYIVAVAGMIFACQTIGLRWSSVQWLIAAMTVGLGFGLQEIFANLVSGLIILFEQPIRLGDLVTVGGLTGKVTRMQIRATTITDFDRRELVVPNKKFITDDVINWTLTDPITRVVIPIGVAYGSDTKLTHNTLLNVAERHPLVLREPAAAAVFTGFGDSTLNFELRFYLGSRDVYGQVLHEMNTNIDEAFREAKLEIAFPQQDIHIRSVESVLPSVVGVQAADAAKSAQPSQNSGPVVPSIHRREAA